MNRYNAAELNCSLFKLPDRQLVSTYQHNGEVFALWSRDSSFAIDPNLDHQVQFGIVRFTFDEKGSLPPDVQTDNLFLDFTDSVEAELREVTSHLFHQGRIIFTFSEKFSGNGMWGKRNFVIAYNIESAIWEIGHSRLTTGDISFKPWLPQMGSRDELKISYGELELFLQDNQLKVGVDHTPYHLDDWTRDTDFAKVAPSSELPEEKWRRQGSIIVREDRSGDESDVPEYAPPVPLMCSDTRVKALIPIASTLLTFENIAAVVKREFEEQYLLDELCYTAQHIHREDDQKKLPLVHTLSQEEKGVPLTGKLSDLLLAHPAPVVPPAKYALIPAIRYADSVLACTKTGAHIAALVVDTLHRTSCVLFVPLSDLSSGH